MKRLLALVLLCASLSAHAEYIDLSKGGMMVAPPQQCVKNNRPFVCIFVSHQQKLYLVVHDQRGEKEIHEINEKGEATLIWDRDSV